MAYEDEVKRVAGFFRDRPGEFPDADARIPTVHRLSRVEMNGLPGGSTLEPARVKSGEVFLNGDLFDLMPPSVLLGTLATEFCHAVLGHDPGDEDPNAKQKRYAAKEVADQVAGRVLRELGGSVANYMEFICKWNEAADDGEHPPNSLRVGWIAAGFANAQTEEPRQPVPSPANLAGWVSSPVATDWEPVGPDAGHSASPPLDLDRDPPYKFEGEERWGSPL